MKYSKSIAIVSVALVFISAFLPWVYIDSGEIKDTIITGIKGTRVYGSPALLGMIFAALFLLTVFVHKVWLKLAGVFFGVVVLAWSIRNYYMFQCAFGYCPEKKIGLYLTLLAAAGIMFSALVPHFPDKYRTDD